MQYNATRRHMQCLPVDINAKWLLCVRSARMCNSEYVIGLCMCSLFSSCVHAFVAVRRSLLCAARCCLLLLLWLFLCWLPTIHWIELYTSLYYNYTFLWFHVHFMYKHTTLSSPFGGESQGDTRIFAWPAAFCCLLKSFLCFQSFVIAFFALHTMYEIVYTLILIFDRATIFFCVCNHSLGARPHHQHVFWDNGL